MEGIFGVDNPGALCLRDSTGSSLSGSVGRWRLLDLDKVNNTIRCPSTPFGGTTAKSNRQMLDRCEWWPGLSVFRSGFAETV
jgi:hypothetical protein